MSSFEWSDTQLRLLIDERKQRNSEYHTIPNKKKQVFWEDIANKLNSQENTNYFNGEDCRKKFLTLTKAFNVAKKYREGSGSKKSLVGEKLYEEFSSKFWLKPELPFEREHNQNVRRLSGATSSQETSSSIPTPEVVSGRPKRSARNLSKNVEKSSTPPSRAITVSTETPVISRPVTPSIETPTISRPVTPTLPSFSQSANVINVTINNNYTGAPNEED